MHPYRSNSYRSQRWGATSWNRRIVIGRRYLFHTLWSICCIVGPITVMLTAPIWIPILILHTIVKIIKEEYDLPQVE